MDTFLEAPRTRSGRRGAIDVARVGALVMVVLGHLTLAIIDRGPDGAIRGANALALAPDLAWIAMLAPMPVFFAAAGWANATATPRSAAPRLRTLVGLAAAVVVSWSTLSMLEFAVHGGGAIADGARIATQPLWFLAVYVPLAAFGSNIAQFAERLAWGVPWLLGAWWRRRWRAGWTHERRTGAALVVIASGCAVGLVLFAGYDPALIDAVEGQRSNTTPPGLFTATAAIVQVGLLMLAASWLDRLAELHRGLFDRGGEASVAVYVWHLSALALCAAVLAAGVWAPARFSGAWWLTRPLWFAAVLGVTGLLAAATSWTRARLDGAAVGNDRRRRVRRRLVVPAIAGQPTQAERHFRSWPQRRMIKGHQERGNRNEGALRRRRLRRLSERPPGCGGRDRPRCHRWNRSCRHRARADGSPRGRTSDCVPSR